LETGGWRLGAIKNIAREIGNWRVEFVYKTVSIGAEKAG
jgi:hypothetical protein